MNLASRVLRFCREHDIQRCQVTFRNLDDSFYISWEGDIDSYLQHLIKENITCIYIDTYKSNYNQFKDFIKDEEIFNECRDSEEISKILQILEKCHDTEIETSLMASVSSERIIFKEFSKESNDIFNYEKDLIRLTDAIISDKKDASMHRYSLRRDSVKPYAIELAEHSEYQKAIWKEGNIDILLDSILSGRDWIPVDYPRQDKTGEIILKMDIKSLANSHFKIIVEPKLDETRIKKIKDWKTSKMKKIEMCSRLEISLRKLNSLYYLTE